MKRGLIICLVLLTLACGAFAAGQKEGGSSTGASVSTSTALPVTDKKISLKILCEDNEGYVVGNNMIVMQELEKRTNVHLDFTLLPLDGASDKFNLVMASGDLPDIVQWGDTTAIDKLGTQGALIPLQDLMKKYAPDMTAQLANPLPNEKLPYKVNLRAEVTAMDGNIYTVPLVSASSSIGAVWAIRVDWLQKLGMKVPQTLDDLYAALKAFKDKDPNGNGKADEIPLIDAHAMKGEYVLPLINAFGAHMGLYVAKDGTVKYGPMEAKYKEGLTFLNKLYTEGLLDPDYLSTTRDQWRAKATGNLAGLMFAWPAGGIGGTNNSLAKLDPSYRFEPMLPVKGPYGDKFKDVKTSGSLSVYRTSITKSNKYPEITMKYFNYLFTAEGDRLVHYGIEGTHYTMVNGKPTYTDLVMKNPQGLDPETARNVDGLNMTWLAYVDGWGPDFQAMSIIPATIQAWTIYRDPGVVEAPFPSLKYTEEEAAAYSAYRVDIDKTYVPEMVNKFIMGTEPLSNFDAFVAQLKKMKVEEWLKTINTAYARYQKNAK